MATNNNVNFDGTTLTITGDEAVTGNAQSTTTNSWLLQSNAGSASNPSYGFNGDANTGMYRSAADTLVLATAGSDRLKITSSGELTPVSIHNNGGNGTSATPALASGTYTPTYTPNARTVSTSGGVYGGWWQRTGNVVTIGFRASVKFDSGPSASFGNFTLSLPSGFNAVSNQGAGTAHDDSVGTANFWCEASGSNILVNFNNLGVAYSNLQVILYGTYVFTVSS